MQLKCKNLRFIIQSGFNYFIFKGNGDMNEWYKQKLRRNLIDMHIEEWNKDFLYHFDPDEYYNNLVEANINAPMIYFQSFVGLCYWPTKSGKMHNAFIGREDQIRRLVDKCHKADMAVIGYYSLIFNNWAYNRYPEWQMRDIHNHGSMFDGSRYGMCCLNSQAYKNFVAEQIAEFSDYFQFEGLFLDMTFWPMVCYCDNCKTRWKKENGGEIPVTIDWSDPEWIKFQQKRIEWLSEFAQFATGEVKKHKSDCSVEHQYATAINHSWKFGVTENISLASDYSGGDLYGGIAEQSFACKVYYNLTRNQPFEYMTSRCYTSLNEHTTTKSMDLLRLGVMVTYLHHGACLLIDAIDPVGTIDKRVYQKIGSIFRETEALESYLKMGKHVFDVGLYYNMCGKMNTLKKPIPVDQEKDNISSPHDQAVMGAANSLRVHHIPYSVLNNSRPDLLPEIKVLVLSDVPFLSDGEITQIKNYIQNGGSTYISGCTCPELVEEIFSVKFNGYTEHKITYISPTNEGIPVMQHEFTYQYPLAMFEPQPQFTGKPQGKIYGTLTLPFTLPDTTQMNCFASIHSNPPGIFTDTPAMMITNYGKGRVFYSSLPLERAKREQHSDIFAGIIRMLMGDEMPAFSSSNAPEAAEFILFKDDEKELKLLGVINIQESFHIIPLNNFTVSVLSKKPPRDVYILPDKKQMLYKYEKQMVNIPIDHLDIYKMILLQF